MPPIATWADRLAAFGRTGSFDRADLNGLRAKVTCLSELLRDKPVLGWLMDCNTWMQPSMVVLDPDDPNDQTERDRYGRCFDHLVTLLDENFVDAPVSPSGLLEWLRIKVATDETEDEPDPSSRSTAKVTVVTVHKAKGLEFDRVLIPATGNPFGSESWTEELAIVPGVPMPRLLWKWSPKGFKDLTNVAPTDDGLWSGETREKVREETRLLYVAMTRAKTELQIVLPKKVEVHDPPKSWAELLVSGGVG